MIGMTDFIKSCYIKNDNDNFYLNPENLIDDVRELELIKTIDQVLLKYMVIGGDE